MNSILKKMLCPMRTERLFCIAMRLGKRDFPKTGMGIKLKGMLFRIASLHMPFSMICAKYMKNIWKKVKKTNLLGRKTRLKLTLN